MGVGCSRAVRERRRQRTVGVAAAAAPPRGAGDNATVPAPRFVVGQMPRRDCTQVQSLTHKAAWVICENIESYTSEALAALPHELSNYCFGAPQSLPPISLVDTR